MNGETHIASCVVHVRPERVVEVEQNVRARELAEVHAADPRGRLVVLLERSSAAEVLQAIETMRNLAGVVAVNLVYQHAENESALKEPLP